MARSHFSKASSPPNYRIMCFSYDSGVIQLVFGRGIGAVFDQQQQQKSFSFVRLWKGGLSIALFLWNQAGGLHVSGILHFYSYLMFLKIQAKPAIRTIFCFVFCFWREMKYLIVNPVSSRATKQIYWYIFKNFMEKIIIVLLSIVRLRSRKPIMENKEWTKRKVVDDPEQAPTKCRVISKFPWSQYLLFTGSKSLQIPCKILRIPGEPIKLLFYFLNQNRFQRRRVPLK